MTGETDSDWFDHEHVTIIEPRSGWSWREVQELWAYRELLLVLTQRDLKVRYKQTVIGAGWALIQPVLTMVLFTIVFGRLAQIPSDGYPYPVFVYAALLPWTFFASAVGSAGNSMVGSANLVTKIYFPRLIIPLASAGSWLIDFLIASIILLVLMLWYGVGFTLNLLAVPFLVVALLLTALGAGTFLAALIVSYRDFRYVIPFMLQFWMFASPVVYSGSLVPEGWRWLLFLNPMSGVIDGFRSAFLGKPFEPLALTLSMAMALLFFIGGVWYFRHVQNRFADVI